MLFQKYIPSLWSWTDWYLINFMEMCLSVIGNDKLNFVITDKICHLPANHSRQKVKCCQLSKAMRSDIYVLRPSNFPRARGFFSFFIIHYFLQSCMMQIILLNIPLSDRIRPYRLMIRVVCDRICDFDRPCSYLNSNWTTNPQYETKQRNVPRISWISLRFRE